jgi:hypothetical protein
MNTYVQSLEAVGWMLVAVSSHASLKHHISSFISRIQSSVSETASSAHFITSYDDTGSVVVLSSNSRCDAVVLTALLHLDVAAADDDRSSSSSSSSSSSLCTKIVSHISSSRNQYGRWSTTNENSFVLVALGKYFETFEKNTPNVTVNMYFDDLFAGTHKYEGRSMSVNEVKVPMEIVMDKSKTSLTSTSSSSSSSSTPSSSSSSPSSYRAVPVLLHKDGVGRVYYRLSLNYAPSNFVIDSASYGFRVTRHYYHVNEDNNGSDDNDSNSKSVESTVDGVFVMKVGQKVKVVVKMATKSVRHHVALVDYIPAGKWTYIIIYLSMCIDRHDILISFIHSFIHTLSHSSLLLSIGQ